MSLSRGTAFGLKKWYQHSNNIAKGRLGPYTERKTYSERGFGTADMGDIYEQPID